MTDKALFEQLQQATGGRLIAYVTGDRQPFTTRIAGDIIPLLDRLLAPLGRPEKISLFLYTGGGDMIVPLRLVKLIRAHCRTFEVLVPYRAHSAGTLIALGADRVIMDELGELSPVDPRTGHPFNPENPANPKQKLEVSVEDLNSYFLLASEKAGVQPEQMHEIFRLLVDKLHPLSLGNAYRAYRMTRLLTTRLLELHLDREADAGRIRHIVQQLTGDITIHNYPIDREEAAAIGLAVEPPGPALAGPLKELYRAYARRLRLDQPFTPAELLPRGEFAEFNYTGACAESDSQAFDFVFHGQARKSIRDNKAVVDMNIASRRWAGRGAGGETGP